MTKKKQLNAEQTIVLFEILKKRFEANMHRHQGLSWVDIEEQLKQQPEKLWVLNQMEETGGEPDIVSLDSEPSEIIFYDCAVETPKGRRSLCYDRAALDARKEHKPENNAVDVAEAMGIELLTEEQYRQLQSIEHFDLKTSSWVRTPEDVRKLGGAIFCDSRYGRVFTYHNGAQSYYATRGFRGRLKL
ncbi:DUF4256 domain-containing protein [Acinetobacter sp. NIPH1876]|uniref:DUF4256 domain-containing protein n=1 Tax=Acinetobacter TaxID=469 RepID=UPI001F4A164A|nr:MULTISPECIES: DUF4256 domain-containing protein [Acinetobacter]MCH7303588.1 DUF4256 domain-containing protein [Acinetobacter higginsii]MCH7339185.1 DUF4256 domain-containing protein [Acinetobacter higginsii]MCJ0830051.1 DUF4256 domain-containing protein [Acinetobacter sp. NIPH1876]